MNGPAAGSDRVPPPAPARPAGGVGRGVWLAAAAALSLTVAVSATLAAILPLHWALAVAAVVLWFAAPGLPIGAAVYGRQPGAWIGALLLGSVWGHTFSTLALLALWMAGFRGAWILAIAPVLVLPIALLARRLQGNLVLPHFTRRDLVAVCLLLLLVPAIVGRPFARVGVDVPDGRAYRAYFTADFIWRMAVAAEVAKGDMPPRNQFLGDAPLNYYWLPHLLPAVQHQWRGLPVRLDQILLVHSVVLDLVFVAFMYGFARQLVSSPAAAALGCAAAVLFTSFEGLERLWLVWRESLPLGVLRNINIDAVVRWYYGSLPVDGLQRLLWYQPHHAMGYAAGLSALLCATQARNLAKAGLMVWLGTLLAASLLISTFAALMFATMATFYVGVRLLAERRFGAIVPLALAAAAPLAVALAVALQLHYVDRGESLIELGLNPAAGIRVLQALPLSFGPMIVAIPAALWLALRRREPYADVFGVIVGISLLFYFFVDVRDHQNVYVGWRAGHLIFFAAGGLAGYALQEGWRARRPVRTMAVALAVLLALASAPTMAIDFYNTQDIDNRSQGPGFRWTLVLTPEEIEALDWIRVWTAPDARVQVEPSVRNAGTWAYIPAFAERRMVAGLPIGMVPLDKYQAATGKVTELYRTGDARLAHERARALGIDYLVIGEPERSAYPEFARLVTDAPIFFRPAHVNSSVGVYKIAD
ncbi:MAG: hypothetical protein AB7Q29_18145 [Vicinamibacterales bacterium]